MEHETQRIALTGLDRCANAPGARAPGCDQSLLRGSAAPLPLPELPITIRPATMADLPFIDALQKQHARQLGYFPTRQFEDYIATGGVLIAEEAEEARSEKREASQRPEESASGTVLASSSSLLAPRSLGYIISRDRYLKRDELGVVYQLCVAPGHQRKLLAAALLREVFDRSAYGCRLYCCWCAQDLAANRFWESMGFVPIAFRGGSGRKGRVHIFWQKRIREGDVMTPWWFPAKTEGGAMREDRLVLPIPPGLHWSDEMPVLKPQSKPVPKRLPAPGPASPPVPGTRRDPQDFTPPNAVQFGPPGPPGPPGAAPTQPMPEKASRAPEASGQTQAPREKPRCDPTFIAAARELRDRWLEQVNADPSALLPDARYHLARALPTPPSTPRSTPRSTCEARALPAAA